MYGTIIRKNGTDLGRNGTHHLKRGVPSPLMATNKTELYTGGEPASCGTCGGARICVREGEVCCAGCGTVLGTDYQPEHAEYGSKLNLYQATEVGTARVALDCARHMHEAHPDKSLLSNACTKLQLPMHASREAAAIYHKVIQHRRKEKVEHALRLKHLALRKMAGLAESGELEALKANSPAGCTRAHTAAFAIHTVCRKLGLPRTEDEILEAIRMNFGARRNFTMLKAYTLNETVAREAGIECRYASDAYYVRLLLAGMRKKIGTGRMYDRVMRDATMNLQYVTESRANARASRAVSLALRGIRLYVPV